MRYYRANYQGRLHAVDSCPNLSRSYVDRRCDVYAAAEAGTGLVLNGGSTAYVCNACSSHVTSESEHAQVVEAVTVLNANLANPSGVDTWQAAGELFVEAARLRKHLTHLTESLPQPLAERVNSALAAADQRLDAARRQLGPHPALEPGSEPVVALDASFSPWADDCASIETELMVAADLIVTDPARHCAAMLLPATPDPDQYWYRTVRAEPGDDVEVLRTAVRIANLDMATFSASSTWGERQLAESLTVARMIHHRVTV